MKSLHDCVEVLHGDPGITAGSLRCIGGWFPDLAFVLL